MPNLLMRGVNDHVLLRDTNGALLLIALTPQSQLLIRRHNGERWSPLRALSLSEPAVIQGAGTPQMSATLDAMGLLHVVYRTQDNAMAHITYDVAR